MRATIETRYLAIFVMLLLVGLFILPAVEAAREVSLGTPVTRQDAGFTITASYEAPLAVEGSDSSDQPLFLSSDKADLFLTVDIRAGKGNKNGFGAGEFIPYLSVSYTLRRHGGGEVQVGHLYPIASSKGIRYGNNVKLTELGSYTLTLMIEPPIKVGFGRHTDLETGVSKWWKPFQVERTFKYSRSAK